MRQTGTHLLLLVIVFVFIFIFGVYIIMFYLTKMVFNRISDYYYMSWVYKAYLPTSRSKTAAATQNSTTQLETIHGL